MKTLAFIVGMVFIAIAGFGILSIPFLNSEMTSAQLFINCWSDYLAYLIIMVIGILHLILSERL